MPARKKAAKKDSTAHLGFEAKLWLAADKLRNNMDAAEPSGARWTTIGSPEGSRGGANQFDTPSCVVRLLVEMLAPYKGRIYDPACGSGGMFASLRRPCGKRFARRKRASARGIVQSEEFVESHGGTAPRECASISCEATLRSLSTAKGNRGDISIYGQEQRAWGARFGRAERARRVRLRRKQPNQSNPTTRCVRRSLGEGGRLAIMKLCRSLPQKRVEQDIEPASSV